MFAALRATTNLRAIARGAGIFVHPCQTRLSAYDIRSELVRLIEVSLAGRTNPSLVAARGRQRSECAGVIDFEAELYRLAADLTVLDVACGARTGINWRLKALAAIRALNQVKLHAACGAAIRGYAGIDHRLETVLHVDTPRSAQFNGAFAQLRSGDGPLHGLTIRPSAVPVNPQWVNSETSRNGALEATVR